MDSTRFPFTMYRKPKKSDESRKSVPMTTVVSPTEGSEEDAAASARGIREWVVLELEKIFYTFGNPLKKGSSEIESQLWGKSRSQDEYTTLAHRLLRHMREMAIQRQASPLPMQKIKFPSQEVPLNLALGCSPPTSVSIMTSPRMPVDPTNFFPRGFEFSPSTVMSIEPQTWLNPVMYEVVRLPAPNKRTNAVAVPTVYKTTRFDTNIETSSEDDHPEILTRLVREDDGDEDSGSDLSTDTYETNFRFLVPRNSLIRQVTVHLKKLM